MVVSKIKGHAAEADIAKGKSDQWLKDGNDNADSGATHAYSKFSGGLVCLTNLCAMRLEQYTHFMTASLRFLVHLFLEEQRLRKLSSKLKDLPGTPKRALRYPAASRMLWTRSPGPLTCTLVTFGQTRFATCHMIV